MTFALNCISTAQKGTILEQLTQIYIVAHLWKEEILSFSTLYHSNKSNTLSNLKSCDHSSTTNQC